MVNIFDTYIAIDPVMGFIAVCIIYFGLGKSRLGSSKSGKPARYSQRVHSARAHNIQEHKQQTI